MHNRVRTGCRVSRFVGEEGQLLAHNRSGSFSELQVFNVSSWVKSCPSPTQFGPRSVFGQLRFIERIAAWPDATDTRRHWVRPWFGFGFGKQHQREKQLVFFCLVSPNLMLPASHNRQVPSSSLGRPTIFLLIHWFYSCWSARLLPMGVNNFSPFTLFQKTGKSRC